MLEVPLWCSRLRVWLGSMKMRVQSLAFLSVTEQRSKGFIVVMSCIVGYVCGLELVLLWCWLSAVALIRPLAWKLHLPQMRPSKGKKKDLITIYFSAFVTVICAFFSFDLLIWFVLIYFYNINYCYILSLLLFFPCIPRLCV